jgi:hypothetical protein
MTTRTHLSATQGGGRRSGLRWWCWADLGRKVGCAAEQGSRAEREKKTSWATGGLAGLRAEREKLGLKKMFCKIFKKIQTNEFKHRFEFSQSKIVLQHECNNKLLCFINLIKKKN